MVITRYMELLESAIKVSEAELRAKYDQENRFRNLEFVRFDPKDTATAGVAPTDAEIQSYAQGNGEKLKAHYEARKTEFIRPKTVTTQRILLNKPEKNADQTEAQHQDAVAQVKARAEEALAKASEPDADFVAISLEYSNDILNMRGGTQEKQTEDEKRFPDYSKVKDLNKGELTGLLENENWFYFYKAVDTETALNRSLEEATADIARLLLQQDRQTAAAKARAEAFLTHVKSTGKMTAPAPTPQKLEEGQTDAPEKTVAAPKWPAPETTGDFREDALPSVPNLTTSTELARSILKLTSENQVLDEVLTVEGALWSHDSRRSSSLRMRSLKRTKIL